MTQEDSMAPRSWKGPVLRGCLVQTYLLNYIEVKDFTQSYTLSQVKNLD